MGKGHLIDETLVDDARDGSEEAFRGLVERYENRVATIVIGMLGDTAEAEDVGQETFIRFYRNLKTFRGEASVGTYLSRIAINLSLNEIKKRQRRSIFIPFNLGSKRNDTREFDFVDPKASAEYDDTNDRIRRALDHLKPKFRSVIVLRLMEGYSTKETAEILQLPLGTVLSRLKRAQEKLRHILITYREHIHETS